MPGARGSLAQGWGPRHRECAARVSAGACAPCARGVRSRGAAGTRRLGAPLPRCGSRDALPRRLSAPPRCPHRGTAGLGVPLRSSSFSGLLRLWPRGRVRLSGPDSASGRALVTLSRRPFLPALESGGRGRPGACSPHRLRVCRGGGGGRAARPWPGARVWIGAGSWPEAKAADVAGHRRPRPTCRGWTLGRVGSGGKEFP